MSNDWIKKLKVGDKVLIVRHGYARFKYLTVVTKITGVKKVTIHTKNGYKFGLDGHQTPYERFYNSSLVEPTEENLIEYRKYVDQNKYIKLLNDLNEIDDIEQKRLIMKAVNIILKKQDIDEIIEARKKQFAELKK